MEPILIDTSVWIDWFNKKSINNSRTELLRVYFERNKPVYTTAIILQEVLQGIREDRVYHEVKEILLSASMLLLDPIDAAIGAAELYRSLRKKGITIRKPNDCLIAHYALFYDISVLHNDIDFDQIALHTPLRIAAA